MARFLALTSIPALFLAMALQGCTPKNTEGLCYAVTIPPAAAILAKVAGERAQVAALVGPGASPHTFEPRPADVRLAESAMALFQIAPEIDGWAAAMPAQRHIALFALLPEEMRLPWQADEDHNHGREKESEFNPHFWLNPKCVQAILPGLVDILIRIDPEGAEIYRGNADRFANDLQALDTELEATLAETAGASVALFHPSMNYMLDRYHIKVAGFIEPFPGKEASAQYLKKLAETLKAAGVSAIFTEPQLARRPAELTAEMAGLQLFELDPLGGVPGRLDYDGLMRYNAQILCRALAGKEK